ncbi:MAG: hypothetical protein ABSE99_10230 [Terracidiphilus sp.]
MTPDQQPKPSTDVRAGQEAIQLLLAALKPEGKSARLDYRGTCDVPDSDVISFPSVKVDSPREAGSSTSKVTEMLRDNRDISVNEDASGIIRIKVAGVSGAILQTRIAQLALDRDEQYDPNAAIRAILNAKDFQSAVGQLHTRLAMSGGGLENIPKKGMPHLEQSWKDVTVDQALNSVLRTFPGLVEYKECVRPNGDSLFNIRFYGQQ